jgi:hypothetical protein
MLGQQLQEAQRKRQQEATQQQALQSYIQTLPEDQRARFAAFPTQAAEAMFREVKPAPGVVGEYNAAVQSGLITPDTTLEQYVAMKKPPGTTVNVPVNLSTEKKYGESFATQVAQEDVKLRESALAAPSQLDTIQQTKSLLEQGKVFTGKFADQKLALAAAGQALGVTGADTNEVVANTQRLFANRAKATLDNVRNSGLGAGQGFTDRDRDFLEKAVLGNISFTAESLKRQLEIEERVARGSVSKWNNRFKQLPQSTVEATGITPVDITPRPTQPETGNPAGGNLMDAARRELERRGGR